MQESANHSGAQRSAVKGRLLYLDPRDLTRDCIGHWFVTTLEEFDVKLLGHPNQLDELSLNPDSIRGIIFNAGAESVASDLVIDWLERLRKSVPDAPIILLSSREDRDEIIDGFELGIRGYIPTNLAPDVVAEAVRLVCSGGTFAPVS